MRRFGRFVVYHRNWFVALLILMLVATLATVGIAPPVKQNQAGVGGGLVVLSRS